MATGCCRVTRRSSLQRASRANDAVGDERFLFAVGIDAFGIRKRFERRQLVRASRVWHF